MGVSSPAAPSPFKDYLTGDSRDFASSLGGWTNSGGTLTRDTTYKLSPFAASAKFAVTANTHYMEAPLSGTFLAGVEYWGLVLLSIEETTGTHALDVILGVPGTDSATADFLCVPTGTQPMQGNGRFVAVAVRWKPTANRTGVKLRVKHDTATTATWHVGMARVLRQANEYYGGPPLMVNPATPTEWIIPLSGTYAMIGPYTGAGIALQMAASGNANLLTPSGKSSLDTDSDLDAEMMLLGYGEHTPSDLSDRGVVFEVGTHYVGVAISEKDSSTVQLYADLSTGYMMQLRNRGSGKGWAVSDDGTLNQKITDTFQWAFYVAGAQTTGTNKAAYFQVPEKCKIDEVRIHLGTAPTGTNFIVDVNDDGTTIFTTQGNRPEIATGANDDTSGTPDGGTSVAKDSVLTIDVDQIGSGTAGSDLVVFVRGRFIW